MPWKNNIKRTEITLKGIVYDFETICFLLDFSTSSTRPGHS